MPRRFLVFVLAVAALCAFAAPAVAAPGAYKVLLAEAYSEQPKRLAAQVSSFPDVATVDLADTGTDGVTPTAAQLAGYDIVVSIGDSSYLDSEAWGNALADYVDGGGVVVVTAYDTWEDSDPLGRFASAGYLPVLVGNNVNDPRLLGAFDPADPLMQGVGSLFSSDNTTNELAPGASLVARWNDGSIAIARKGRVVAITGFIGDNNGDVWSGDYGRVIVNTVRTIGNQLLSVSVANPAGGTVTSSAGGIVCGAVCSALLPASTIVTLTAKPQKGFAFGGFGGACVGRGCALKLESGLTTVSASFVGFKAGKKIKLNESQGKGILSVTLGAPGKLVLSGKKVKTRSRLPKKARTVKLPILAKGKALTKLKQTGKAKVNLKLSYTPTGGATTTQTKSVVLKLNG